MEKTAGLLKYTIYVYIAGDSSGHSHARLPARHPLIAAARPIARTVATEPAHHADVVGPLVLALRAQLTAVIVLVTRLFFLFSSCEGVGVGK